MKLYFTYVCTTSTLCAQTLVNSFLLKNVGWFHSPLNGCDQQYEKPRCGGYERQSWSQWRSLQRGVTWAPTGQCGGKGWARTDSREEGALSPDPSRGRRDGKMWSEANTWRVNTVFWTQCMVVTSISLEDKSLLINLTIIFIKHVLCVGHCFRHWRYSSEQKRHKFLTS